MSQHLTDAPPGLSPDAARALYLGCVLEAVTAVLCGAPPAGLARARAYLDRAMALDGAATLPPPAPGPAPRPAPVAARVTPGKGDARPTPGRGEERVRTALLTLVRATGPEGRKTVTELSEATGLGYGVVNGLVLRSPYFEKCPGNARAPHRLTQAGRGLLAGTAAGSDPAGNGPN